MRLVLVRLSALGDIVHTWPLALALKQARSDLHLTWIVEEPLRLLVEGHPAVDAVVTVSTHRWRRSPLAVRTRKETAALHSQLRAMRADVALDPQGTLKSAWVTRLTRAGARVGLARPWRRERIAGFAYTTTFPGSLSDPHVVATNLALAAAVGSPAATQAPEPNGSWLGEKCRSLTQTFDRVGKVAVLLPGAGHASKTMSHDTLAEVARGLASRGLRSMVAWGPGEQEEPRPWSPRPEGLPSLAPPTDLCQLTALLGTAQLVVGGDTGPVHLAASLGTPTVGVFITTDWRRNGPLGKATAVVCGATLPPRVVPGSARASRGRMPDSAEIITAAYRLLD